MRRAYGFIVLSAAGVACFSVVDVVYFQTLGYSLAFIGLMAAAFNLAVTATELPFAILFDRYSNKLALQVGNLARIGAFALFFWSVDPQMLLLAQVIAGIAVAAASGTSNALVINQVSASVDDTGATRAFGRITYLVAGASLVGGIVGICLYTLIPRTIWLAAIGFYLAAAVIILGFDDTRAAVEKIPWRTYSNRAFSVVRMRSTVVLILVNASAVAPFLIWQIKFNQVSVSFILLGFLLMNGARLIAPLVLQRVPVKTRSIGLAASCNALAAGLFAVSSDSVSLAMTFALHVLLHTVLIVLASGQFHSLVTNEIRATASSIVSLLDSLVVALVAPLIGWIGQSAGLTPAVGMSCILYVAIAVLARRKRSTQVTATAPEPQQAPNLGTEPHA
ncbi:MFS transporter [Plantibacter auratus]|uniref:MFS transporter n=1 Tax=Plantibacter auratus TaxID=272914 RepID=UPI003D339B02